MGDAYRIATKVPWEHQFRDWSRLFPTVDGVTDELASRARGHRGKEFREKVRGTAGWGKDRELDETIQAVRHDLVAGRFGDVVIVEANRDGVEWRLRKIRIEDDPSVNLPEANEHIDFLYGWIFRDHRAEYPGVENWGTCNRRYIDGTSTWSQHSPWLAGPGGPATAGCNAIDVHSQYQVMYMLSRNLAGKDHVAKILFYDHEWTPETGWISYSVGHYDHVHVEGPRNHGGLASACNY